MLYLIKFYNLINSDLQSLYYCGVNTSRLLQQNQQ